MSRGIYVGAVVMRGADWRWHDQDGGIGCRGRVCAIEGWEESSFRSVAHVTWSHSQVLNIYCVGHNGLVDVQCVEPANGGLYYPDHLPLLGKEYSDDDHGLRTGDGARIELDPGVFKAKQEGHGGWQDYMAEYVGCDGAVHAVLFSGDVIIRYKNGRIMTVNPDCITKVDDIGYDCGDVVRVCEDMSLVHQLQIGHGNWIDDMAMSLGQVGRVMKIQSNGNVRVAVNGSRWLFNPKCLTPAPGEVPMEEKTGQLHVDMAVRIQTKGLCEAACPDVVVMAAEGGDLETLTQYLSHHPEHVDTVYDGRTAVHVATVERYLPILKFLISYRANLDKKNAAEYTALHICSVINSVEATRLLLEGGANPNIADDRGVTPLIIATSLGYVGVVEALLDHPRIDPNVQDNQGDTALHLAVLNHHLRPLIALLSAGADPTVRNHSLFNCIQRAARVGFVAGIEEILKWHPNLINVAKKDGVTPLHSAALEHHADVVSLLCSHFKCDVNVEDTDNLTPLHLAAYSGCPVMIERLVGCGADLNVSSDVGNTPLHFAMNRGNMALPSSLCPQILEMKQELDEMCGKNTLSPGVVVGVFLVREGANIHAVNKTGLHPLSFHPPDVTQLISRYSDIKPKFHGKLRQVESPFSDVPLKIPLRPVRVASIEDEKSSASYTTTAASKLTAPPPTAVPTTSPSITRSSSYSYSSTTQQSGVIHQPKSPHTAPVSKIVETSDNEFHRASPMSPMQTYDKDINPYTKQTATMDTVGAGMKFTLNQCSLCEEEPVSVRLQPCGHLNLCDLCGSRAKRCMKKDCRCAVADIIKLCPLCLKSKADQTHRACRKDHHRLCRSCVSRSSTECVLCSSVVLKAQE